ncbi:MAG TPA: hypothetical protein VGY98_09080, partial [Verrucomicrobiae bacterium]|nr:hypothetical protein [Verrucomicrobiae bacterium]
NGRKNCGYIVGANPFWSPDKRHGYANSRADRRNGIGAMMPGIGLDGGVVGIRAFPRDKPEQGLFDQNNDPECDERKPFGLRAMKSICPFINIPSGLGSDPEGGNQKHHSTERPGQRLGLAVTIRVVFIGWHRRDRNRPPHYEGIKNIGEGLRGVGYQGVRMAEDSGQKLGDTQYHVYDDSDKNRT